jgi:hypothetical protein
MIASGIVLMVIALFAFILFCVFEEEQTDGAFFGIFVGFVFICGIALVISEVHSDDPIEHKASEYTVKAKTVTTLIDDKVVSSDTIYIFTPKLNK